jgi:hypothetical protein
MPKLSTSKKIDLWVIAFFVFTSALFSIYFRVDIIVSVILYLAIPSLYLWLRETKNAKKILFASVVIGVFLGIAYDLIVELNKVWVIHYSIFPFGVIVLGDTPLGDFFWAFLILFSSITFYEHFLDDEKEPGLSKHCAGGVGVSLIIFLMAVLFSFSSSASKLTNQDAYTILGSLSIVPLLLLLISSSKLRYKIAWLTLFFFVLNLTFEITAILLNQWSFPGKYITMIGGFGIYFPVEEFIFWILLGIPSLIVCYEFIFDDGK